MEENRILIQEQCVLLITTCALEISKLALAMNPQSALASNLVITAELLVDMLKVDVTLCRIAEILTEDEIFTDDAPQYMAAAARSAQGVMCALIQQTVMMARMVVDDVKETGRNAEIDNWWDKMQTTITAAMPAEIGVTNRPN
jgi:hypothetical protein